MAGFEVSINGRFWVSTEVSRNEQSARKLRGATRPAWGRRANWGMRETEPRCEPQGVERARAASKVVWRRLPGDRAPGWWHL